MTRQAKPENALGQNLTRLRRAKGLSQRQAADLMGDAVSCPYLCQIETGKVKSPSLATCITLAKAYEITLEQIAEWAGSPHVERPKCLACGQEIDA